MTALLRHRNDFSLRPRKSAHMSRLPTTMKIKCLCLAKKYKGWTVEHCVKVLLSHESPVKQFVVRIRYVRRPQWK